MAGNANKHNIYIGLTHKDISCSIHGKNDWSVQGLCLIPGNACVGAISYSNRGVSYKKRLFMSEN